MKQNLNYAIPTLDVCGRPQSEDTILHARKTPNYILDMHAFQVRVHCSTYIALKCKTSQTSNCYNIYIAKTSIPVAAEKTKVKAEPLELLDFSTRSGTPDLSVDIPNSSPESSPPKQVKKENYRQSKPFECGVVVVKTEPMEESERKQVCLICSHNIIFVCACVCL